MRAGAPPVLAIAVLLSLPGPAAAAMPPAPVQLEGGTLRGPDAKVVKERAAGGRRAVRLSARATVRRRFSSSHGARVVVVRARAAPCGRRPRVALALGGRRVGARAVRSRRFHRLRFTVPLAVRRGRVVVLRLANPGRGRSGSPRGRPCRRALVLDWLRIAQRPPPAPAPPPPPPPVPAAVPEPVTPPGGYRNPVYAAPGLSDPMVLDVGGAHSDYMAFGTGDRFPVLRSNDLVNWAPAGRALRGRPSWAAQAGEWNPWAPSVIERPGPCPGSIGTRCFVMFHVALHGSLVPATNCIGVAVSSQPGGPYRELGPLQGLGEALDSSGRPLGCGDDAGYSNIDPAPFVEDGRSYLYLSTGHRCAAPSPGVECPFDRQISVIELAPDLLSAIGPRQELFNASTNGWEVAPFGPVVENPWMVRMAGGYALLYSGGAFDGPYGMGYATSLSPTGPFARSDQNPILREREGVLSAGGGMVVTGPKGGSWLAYHGRRGAYTNPRELRIDALRFPSDTSIAIDGPTSLPQASSP